MGIKEWVKHWKEKRAVREWYEVQESKLFLKERKILLRLAEVDLKRLKIELKWLKEEQQRRSKKLDYIN